MNIETFQCKLNGYNFSCYLVNGVLTLTATSNNMNLASRTLTKDNTSTLTNNFFSEPLIFFNTIKRVLNNEESGIIIFLNKECTFNYMNEDFESVNNSFSIHLKQETEDLIVPRDHYLTLIQELCLTLERNITMINNHRMYAFTAYR